MSVSWYDSSRSFKPFFSLQFAIKVNRTLNQRNRPAIVGFSKALEEVSKSISRKSPLWHVLYSLSNDADLILLDEPFVSLSPKEEELLTELIDQATREF